MAAAIVPLVTALAPEIISLITSLIHKSAPAAEQQYGANTGPVKFGQVFGDVIAALTKAAAAGQIDKILPPDPEIQLIIQTVVTSMKLQGLLGETPAVAIATSPSATQAQVVTLAPGQSITIQVK